MKFRSLSAIRATRVMEQWQGIGSRRRPARANRQWQDFSGRVQDRIGRAERRALGERFFNNAGSAFSKMREQRQERMEHPARFFQRARSAAQ